MTGISPKTHTCHTYISHTYHTYIYSTAATVELVQSSYTPLSTVIQLTFTIIVIIMAYCEALITSPVVCGN